MSGVQLALIGEDKAYNAASEWKQRWEETIRTLAALPGQHFTSETIRQIAGEPVDHANAAGAIFSNLARQGVIQRVNYVKSERPSLHGHVLAEWVGT